MLNPWPSPRAGDGKVKGGERRGDPACTRPGRGVEGWGNAARRVLDHMSMLSV
jgi:hypothetical protein